jgi:CheY-like chemotaxis protein
LAISRQIVELMGGKIWVESVVGQGSHFFFEINLPRHDEGSASPLGKQPAKAKSQRLLIVDDTPANLRVARLLLEQAGHTVVTATGVEEAERLCRDARFDVIFMDLQMPGIDGFEGTRRLRAWEATQGYRTPIYALTADARKELTPICAEAGFDGILTKPVRMASFNRVLAPE